MSAQRPLEDRSPPRHDNGQEYLEIPVGASRKWIGFLAYALFFLAVAGVLVLMFMWFTASLRLALVLVTFLVSYMLLMGWWASRNMERRDEP